MNDLWPKDITSGVSKVRTPVSILKEQGSLLGNKTGNVVEGVVRESKQLFGSNILSYNFLLKSPPLNYYYHLFTITYKITLYPVSLLIDDPEIKEELRLTSRKRAVSAKTEEEFKSWLSKLFNTKKVKAIILAILAQSEEGK